MNLIFNKSITMRFLVDELTGRSLYKNIIKRINLDTVRFFLKDNENGWAFLFVSIDGTEHQLSKKKMRLKDINGVLNGDFYSEPLILK